MILVCIYMYITEMASFGAADICSGPSGTYHGLCDLDICTLTCLKEGSNNIGGMCYHTWRCFCEYNCQSFSRYCCLVSTPIRPALMILPYYTILYYIYYTTITIIILVWSHACISYATISYCGNNSFDGISLF